MNISALREANTELASRIIMFRFLKERMWRYSFLLYFTPMAHLSGRVMH
jgi:hypothetical protein